MPSISMIIHREIKIMLPKSNDLSIKSVYLQHHSEEINDKDIRTTKGQTKGMVSNG